MSKNPNARQIGGDHYKNGKVEHWDFVEANGMGYLEGCATKYVTRCRKKHASPIQDLKKALHYTEKLIDLSSNKSEPRFNRRFLGGVSGPILITVDDFAKANDLTLEEREIVSIFVYWRDTQYLRTAKKLIQCMIYRAVEKAKSES